jgi:hypothetical protein
VVHVALLEAVATGVKFCAVTIAVDVALVATDTGTNGIVTPAITEHDTLLTPSLEADRSAAAVNAPDDPPTAFDVGESRPDALAPPIAIEVAAVDGVSATERVAT